jgi:hypothetical protein
MLTCRCLLEETQLQEEFLVQHLVKRLSRSVAKITIRGVKEDHIRFATVTILEEFEKPSGELGPRCKVSSQGRDVVKIQRKMPNPRKQVARSNLIGTAGRRTSSVVVDVRDDDHAAARLNPAEHAR